MSTPLMTFMVFPPTFHYLPQTSSTPARLIYYLTAPLLIPTSVSSVSIPSPWTQHEVTDRNTQSFHERGLFAYLSCKRLGAGF